MATYANSTNLLRGVEHCLLISLPDKPVWCQALLGLAGFYRPVPQWLPAGL